MSISGEFDGLDIWETETKREIQHRMQRAARAAFDTAKAHTPWDRGYLHNSWDLSLDYPRNEDRESAGDGSIGNLRGMHADSTVYLTNGKKYAEFVNDGTSKIPAHQMLEHAMEAANLELSGG